MRDAPETEGLKSGHPHLDVPADVAEGIAAFVAIGVRIGQLTDAHAVEHEQDDAGNGRHGHAGAAVRPISPASSNWPLIAGS